MTSDVGSSHLLEFAFWALWVTAVLRNILSKDPKTTSAAGSSGSGSEKLEIKAWFLKSGKKRLISCEVSSNELKREVQDFWNSVLLIDK